MHFFDVILILITKLIKDFCRRQKTSLFSVISTILMYIFIVWKSYNIQHSFNIHIIFNIFRFDRKRAMISFVVLCNTKSLLIINEMKCSILKAPKIKLRSLSNYILTWIIDSIVDFADFTFQLVIVSCFVVFTLE